MSVLLYARVHIPFACMHAPADHVADQLLWADEAPLVVVGEVAGDLCVCIFVYV